MIILQSLMFIIAISVFLVLTILQTKTFFYLSRKRKQISIIRKIFMDISIAISMLLIFGFILMIMIAKPTVDVSLLSIFSLFFSVVFFSMFVLAIIYVISLKRIKKVKDEYEVEEEKYWPEKARNENISRQRKKYHQRTTNNRRRK